LISYYTNSGVAGGLT